MNIILIISDTLRADHLGCYGNPTVYTPNLNALAARSTVFDRHYAASFPTVPARADFLLGQWTFTFMKWERYPDDRVPLAHYLANHGYLTVGVVDTPFLRDGGMGYDRGFAHFFDLQCQATYHRKVNGWLFDQPRLTEFDYCAPKTFHQAEMCLDRIYTKNFFLMIDVWDPHEPWDPPAWYAKRYLPNWKGQVVSPPYNTIDKSHQTKEDLEIARGCYMAEITMVDRWIGRLLERVESLGIADETAIVFTSDHGYYFGEHGGMFGKMMRTTIEYQKDPEWNSSPLYEEIVHVPLIVYLPGATPHRSPALVSAVDVMPTILDIAGIDARKEPTIHGRSVLPIVHGTASTNRDFVVSSVPLINPGPQSGMRLVDDALRVMAEYQPATITDERWSMLYSAVDQPVELYDLTSDASQMNNVAAQHPDVVRRLHGQYVNLLEEVGTERTLLEPRRQL